MGEGTGEGPVCVVVVGQSVVEEGPVCVVVVDPVVWLLLPSLLLLLASLLSWRRSLFHNKFLIYPHPIPVLFPPFSYFCPQRTLGRLVKTIENLPPNKRLHTFRSYVWLVKTIEIIPPNKRLHTFRSYVLSVMTEEIIPPNKRLHTF